MTSFGSVCSGIEAASQAWHLLGWNTSWVAEIEAAPSRLLAHHYPSVPNLGDMTQIEHYVRAGVIDAPDVLVGGTPCQSFSVAGLRLGMVDPRGQLTISFVKLGDAIDDVRKQRGEPEAVIVWENVPGVLSDKSNAFGCFIAALAGEDEALLPPGEKWSNAGCVFGPKRTVAWRVLDAQYFGVAQRRRRVFVVASARDGFDPTQILFEFEGVRRDSPPSRETRQEIAGTITAGTFVGGRGGKPEGAVANHLQVTSHRMVAFGEYSEDGTASTLKQRDFKDATDLVCYGVDCENNAFSFLEPCGPLMKGSPSGGGRPLPAVLQPALFNTAAPINTQLGLRGSETSNSPREGLGIGKPNDPAFTLQAAHHHAVQYRHEVRRLTPTECERLQSFPDGYTNVAGLSDSARYKALGNSMCVFNMRWLGKRIDEQLKRLT